MKKLLTIPAIVIFMASITLTSCKLGNGKGNQRDKNLEHALLSRLDSISCVVYMGMSDVHNLDDNRLQTIIIFYVKDSIGNREEHNVRVTTNNDCSEIYTWEDLDTKVLEDVKQKVSDKFEKKGIDIDGSLIDALIKLKRR